VLETLTVRSGIVLKPGTPESFQAMLDKDIGQWKAVVKADKTIVE